MVIKMGITTVTPNQPVKPTTPETITNPTTPEVVMPPVDGGEGGANPPGLGGLFDVGLNIFNLAGQYVGGIVDATAGNLVRCAANIVATPLELIGATVNTAVDTAASVITGQASIPEAAVQGITNLSLSYTREIAEVVADPFVWLGGVAGSLVGNEDLGMQIANPILDSIAPNTETPFDFVNPIADTVADSLFAWDDLFFGGNGKGEFMGE